MNIPRNSFRFFPSISLRAGILIGATVLLACAWPVAALADPPKQGTDLAAKKTSEGILFQCSAPDVAAVYLAGDFNSWAENKDGVINDSKYQMEGPDSNGIWRKVVSLGEGTHKFKFNIGGGSDNWFVPDWASKDADGNGVITVAADGGVSTQGQASGGSESTGSGPKTSGGKTAFRFSAPDASTCYLAGDFNTWGENKDGVVSDPKYAMTKGADGVWKMEVALSPGRHPYKFVVDGSKWENDPASSDKDSEGNSVIEVK